MASKLIVNTGSMFSGKSTMLLQQGERHLRASQTVVYLKPSIDTRYSNNEIVTHTGKRVQCLLLDGVTPIHNVFRYNGVEDSPNVVLLDEAQFLSVGYAVDTVSRLLEKGITIYASGLDLDFMGKGFDTTKELMALADEVNKLKAVCSKCGGNATRSAKRNLSNKEVIQLGEKETYIPLCRCCFTEHYRAMGITV